jgi:CHAT domain-containing protein/tetratricopeptide (TPR) repeat protein
MAASCERAGRTWTVVLAVGLVLGGLLGLPASTRGAAPPADLTPSQRREVARAARGLSKEMVQLYRAQRYAEAARLGEQLLGLLRRLYPQARYPQGHPLLAGTLDVLGLLCKSQGKDSQALAYYEQALHGQRLLYPEARHPQGHAELARSLDKVGLSLWDLGEHGKALDYLEQALAMRRKLYPPARFPNGHPEVALSLNNLGLLLESHGEYARAQACHEEALAMRRRLYPDTRHPHGHLALARSLNNLALVLKAKGEYARALACHEESLAMRRRLYPPARFPHGHPDLAVSLDNLGVLLQAKGEFARALACHEEALAMYRRLYPEGRHPQGHPDLAICLNNLGSLLWARKEYLKALGYQQEALVIRRRLYPAARFPNGHPNLATSLDNVGLLLQALGADAAALRYHEQALTMKRKLYPEARFPRGHTELATGLNNLGWLLYSTGQRGKALASLDESLAMWRRLYPARRYPDGHPRLAFSLHNLALLLWHEGKSGKALDYLEQALLGYQRQCRRLAEGAAEAEALALVHSLPPTRDLLLSLTRDADATGTYALVWPGRSAVSRVLQRRHLSALAALSRPAVRRRWDELLEVRQRLTRLLLVPDRPAAAEKEVRDLTGRKEKLERQLSAALPLAEQQALDKVGPADLARSLPQRTAFIDLLRYVRFEHDPKRPGRKSERRTRCYVAFILVPGRPVRRVELGAAELIERALADWRKAIAGRAASPAATQLRRLLWARIAPHLGPDTHTVYLAPDGPLARLPWAALPGSRPGRVLLEEHALAIVPHGHFLLARLQSKPPAGKTAALLAVGAVAYDATPALTRPPPALADLWPADRGGRRSKWSPLPGTRAELQRLQSAAGSPVRLLTGRDAATARLAEELPRARLAHLATHGFFHAELLAEERRRAVEQLADWTFRLDRPTELVGQGTRNPLAYCGLVLAGANRPAAEAGADGGILTGEAVLGLDLRGLELAVLSACRTGLGAEADGECVHHLQHAFHSAGCGNVVASLWDVPDRPTAALMALFYDRLLRKKEPPLEALRQAQLFLYRHPERIKDLAERGAPRLDLAVPAPRTPAAGKRADAKDWAGFVLSGLGR